MKTQPARPPASPPAMSILEPPSSACPRFRPPVQHACVRARTRTLKHTLPTNKLSICALQVCEALPGAFIQAARLLGLGTAHWPSNSILSILFSFCATAFSAAMIVYDIDTDREKRLEDREFFGYIPDEPSRRC
jgi:hypothetical protein